MTESQGASSSVPAGKPDQTPETRRGVVRWLIRETMGVVLVGVVLFISAGRLDWPMGWALVGIYALWVAANALILIPRCPELLVERASRRTDVASWDTKLMAVIGLLTLVKYVVAGLDLRFGWPPPLPVWLQGAALIVSALGYALGTWAMASNAFHSMVYRLQEDRGHSVATGGPYRYVRHPSYLGTIAFELATPLMLGSLWAFIPGGLAALLFVVRTALEDRSLQAELEGYQEYAARVRYRLVPGVW
jgi:protein-S-isoprenylcysteine O-methyltransferase Ste14